MRQIDATRCAGDLAGLQVKKLLEEPTSAAIAVGFNRQKKNRYVLVYDLGGGTFDVSLLRVDGNQFLVEQLGGDNLLGGDNFDDEILNLVADHVRQAHQVNVKADRSFRIRLKKPVEEAKILLSRSDHADINVPHACTVVDPQGRGRRPINIRDCRIDRAEFERRIRPYLNKTLKVVDDVLTAGEIERDDIDEVLLVGGSTYVPSVRSALEHQFPGKVRPAEEVHPMNCVAQGAAVLAAELEKAERQRRPARSHQ